MTITKETYRANVATIRDMFSYMRPHGTPEEQEFIDKYLTPLGFKRDAYKNLVVTVGEGSKILWSSHVDTVHYDGGRQTLHLDDDGYLALSKKSRKTSNCLGADDTAGIFVMTEMIKAGVPGTYVIHHGEESGCIGSSALANGNPDWLKQFDFAIAFDRRGYDSIVTHQCGQRTASDRFADSFAGVLADFHGEPTGYKADDGGVYTDTNEYAHLIPECTNISVGYFQQHSRDEYQNVPHLIWLKEAMIGGDWSKLVCARKPEERRSFKRQDDGYDWMRGYPDYSDNTTTYRGMGAFERTISAYPDIAAQVLQAYGLTHADFLNEVAQVYGDVFDDEDLAEAV